MNRRRPITSAPWHLRLARLVPLATIRYVFPAVMCVIMNRIRIIGILILTLAVIAPQAALADWKIYYTGPAAKMFGSAGRGSFATRAQAEAYRVNRPAFEVSNSYSAGFDSPTYKPPSSTKSSSTQALIAGALMQSFLDGFNNANASAHQAELGRQSAEHQRLLEEQRARAARFLAARHLRNGWDARDSASSASLSDVLGGPLQGTAFFGNPSNPSSSAIRDILSNPYPPGDPFANDPNVVDLRGIENPTPQILRTGQSSKESQPLAFPVPPLSDTETPNPAIRIYQYPDSKGKPNSEKRILVLGVGSDMSETFVEAARKYKGQYDIIIGTDIEATAKNPIVVNTIGTDFITSLKNALDSNAYKELARQKYSEPILKELGRIANPKGEDKLEFESIDMHSKGLLAFSSLLEKGTVSATKVTAYGPAVGENSWALDDLGTYAEAKGRRPGSVVVKVSANDPVPIATQFHPGIAGVAASGAIWLTSGNTTNLSDYVQKNDSRVEVVYVEMPGVTGIRNHYLDNYLRFGNMPREEIERMKMEEIRKQMAGLTYGGW